MAKTVTVQAPNGVTATVSEDTAKLLGWKILAAPKTTRRGGKTAPEPPPTTPEPADTAATGE